jgi:hypothetical protein
MTRTTDGYALCRPCKIVFAFGPRDVFAKALYCPSCLTRVDADDEADDASTLLKSQTGAQTFHAPASFSVA